MSDSIKKGYLNSNFIILTQGNFISAVGTVLYGIALGFWVMKVTGSTALMSISSATVVIPKLILGPFAGTIVDRMDKKTILIWTDMMAGMVILVVTAFAFLDWLQVWEAITAGVIIGLLETFATPAARSALPKIIPKAHLNRANAAYSAAFSASNITGKSLGGILYQMLGAPVVFLINGLSYIYCGISEMFISKMPPGKASESKKTLFRDLLDGVKLIAEVKGLIGMFIIISCLNFFGIFVSTLFLPYFTKTPGLDAAAYGIVMASSTCGTLLGQTAYSIKTTPIKAYPLVFCGSGLISNLFVVVFPFFGNRGVLMILLFLSGLSSAGINIVLNTALQSSIPPEYHGRIFSFVGIIGGALIPLGMITAGVLAEFIDISLLISLPCVILSALFGISYINKSVRDFLMSKNIEPIN